LHKLWFYANKVFRLTRMKRKLRMRNGLLYCRVTSSLMDSFQDNSFESLFKVSEMANSSEKAFVSQDRNFSITCKHNNIKNNWWWLVGNKIFLKIHVFGFSHHPTLLLFLKCQPINQFIPSCVGLPTVTFNELKDIKIEINSSKLLSKH
jgi:hypothetical protein